jgi:UDP-glucuronate 4-epimerase
MTFVEAIQQALGQSAIKEFHDLQPGDVPATYADVDDLIKDVGFKPKTDIRIGIKKFIDWYKAYYKV